MWYSIDINEACVLGGEYHRLCRQFQQAFIAAGAPADMALFAETNVLNDSRRIFLSPGSLQHMSNVIEQFEGYPCDSPEVSNVTLVFGVPSAKSLLVSNPDPVALKAPSPVVTASKPAAQTRLVAAQ